MVVGLLFLLYWVTIVFAWFHCSFNNSCSLIIHGLRVIAALSPWETIGSLGFRNFMLCKKPETQKMSGDGNQTSPSMSRKSSGNWKAWFNKSLNLKVSSHWIEDVRAGLWLESCWQVRSFLLLSPCWHSSLLFRYLCDFSWSMSLSKNKVEELLVLPTNVRCFVYQSVVDISINSIISLGSFEYCLFGLINFSKFFSAASYTLYGRLFYHSN